MASRVGIHLALSSVSSHTPPHAHAHARSHTHTHTNQISLSLSLSLSHTHTHTAVAPPPPPPNETAAVRSREGTRVKQHKATASRHPHLSADHAVPTPHSTPVRQRGTPGRRASKDFARSFFPRFWLIRPVKTCQVNISRCRCC